MSNIRIAVVQRGFDFDFEPKFRCLGDFTWLIPEAKPQKMDILKVRPNQTGNILKFAEKLADYEYAKKHPKMCKVLPKMAKRNF